ncbi:MAG: response regulator transcription factor [Roseburia sp.]|nr:response regulator transcription factor [Roseburia sp.]MCM1097494.1 response regulator transcription factor [Ruminococcus flavefaciens]
MNTVLIIDDDKELCRLMKKCVEEESLAAVTACSGAEGLRLFEENDACSLVILDIMLPDLDGFQILRKIRQTSNVPVLMLTAKSGEEDKVSGLRMGADDYLTKPFSLNELLARVNSLIRRYTLLNPVSGQEPDCMKFRGITIDSVNRLVFLSIGDDAGTGRDAIAERNANTVPENGGHLRPVELTGKEFDLLSFLAANKGKIFTKKQIYTQVWEEEYAFDDSNIMSFISKLRKKIEPDPEHPFYILTVRGVGYRFNKDA